MIRDFDINDAPQLLEIYNFYVESSLTTLDHKKASLPGFSRKMKAIHKKYPFLVYEEAGKILGYTYATRWKDKHGYQKTAESTVYIHSKAKSKGLGTQMYRALIRELKAAEIKVVIGCLTLPNAISVALHEKLGFIKVAHFPGIAIKFGKKIDVGYWQLDLM